eukprot:COSAG04_NODE_90_length_26856_cov_18.273723_24_plen_98_part_00
MWLAGGNRPLTKSVIYIGTAGLFGADRFGKLAASHLRALSTLALPALAAWSWIGSISAALTQRLTQTSHSLGTGDSVAPPALLVSGPTAASARATGV